MPKRLIICCDGTWNTPDQKTDETFTPTNVIKTARALKSVSSDGTPQIVFYDKGVGTGNWLDRLIGGATGDGLLKNVADAYRFLVHNFVTGDEIFLFGFSRGAYTVRSIAGLIRNCGILEKIFSDKIPEALELYRNRKPTSHPNAAMSKKFRSDFSREVKIKFIGVWDTVGALGIPVSELRMLFNRNKHKFHDVQISSIIENAFHAIGVDEKRKPFKATLWDSKQIKNNNMEQRWFPGVHANVGGGYPDSDLANVAFMWMKEKAELCGLEYDNNFVEKNITPNPKGKLYNSMTFAYKIIGKHKRKIGITEKGNEEIHESALERFKDELVEYRPENLMEFLGLIPEERTNKKDKIDRL